MASEISADQAKTEFLSLLDRIATGEEFVVTKCGRPVARLVPIGSADVERRRASIERLKEFSKGRTLGVPVKELIDEGRMRLVRKFLP